MSSRNYKSNKSNKDSGVFTSSSIVDKSTIKQSLNPFATYTNEKLMEMSQTCKTKLASLDMKSVHKIVVPTTGDNVITYYV